MRKYRLPSLSAPKGSTLSQILTDDESVKPMVVRQLYSNGWVTENFVNEVMKQYDAEMAGSNQARSDLQLILGTIGLTLIVAGVVAKNVAVVATVLTGVYSVLGATATAISYLVPYGTIVAGAIVIVAGAIIGISGAIKRKKQKERDKKVAEIGFTTLKDAVKLNDLLLDVENALNQIDSGITIYQFNENVNQQVIIKFDNQLFTITATDMNTTEDFDWKLEVESQDGKTIRQYSSTPNPIVNLFDLENDSMYRWFSSYSGESTVYLYNPSLNLELQEQSNPGKGQEALKNVKQYLPGYYILVSKGDIKKNAHDLQNKLIAILGEKGYAELE